MSLVDDEDEPQGAKTALAESRRTQCVEELRAFALGIPALARAARDGYDVSDAVVAHVADQVAARDPEAFVLVEGSAMYQSSRCEDRKNPRLYAFEVLDRVSSHVSQVVTPPSLEILLQKIQRFTPPPVSRAKQAPYTAIMVSVRSPCTRERRVVFRAEGEPGHEESP